MQHMVKALDKACERWGMHISMEETKTLALREQEPDHPTISIQGQTLEEVGNCSASDVNPDSGTAA